MAQPHVTPRFYVEAARRKRRRDQLGSLLLIAITIALLVWTALDPHAWTWR